MPKSCGRYINIAITAFACLDAALMLYIFLYGGVALRVGGSIVGIGGAKLSCNKLLPPFLVLLILLLLKLILLRPDPIGRFARWCGRNRRVIAFSAAVLALAAVPRILDLTGHSLSPDEFLWRDNGRALIFCLRAHEFKKATATLGHPGIIPSAMIGAGDVYLGKGTSPLSLNLLDPIAAIRMPVALAGVAACLLLYLLGRLVLGDTAAFLAAVFLSLSPAHIESSRVAQLDSVLSLFFLLTILCYLIAEDRRRPGWKIASGVFFGFALLTKTPASLFPVILIAWKVLGRFFDRSGKIRLWEASDLGWLAIGLGIYFALFTKLWSEPQELFWTRFLDKSPRAGTLIGIIDCLAAFPWLQIAAGLLCAYVLVRVSGAAIRGGSVHTLVRGVLICLACLSFIQVFRKPMVNEVAHYAAVSHFAEAGHIKYWMGSVVTRPPHWFYLFMLLVRTPPLMICFMVCGIVSSCGEVCRGGKEAGTRLMCLLEPLVFIAAMSMGGKMGFRYIDPAGPFLCALSACGVMVIAGAGAVLIRERITRRSIGAFAGALVAASIIVPLARVAPAYDMYYNVFIGGLPGAARSYSIGYGVGAKESAEYLRTHLQEGDSLYAFGISGEINYYLSHATPPLPRGTMVNADDPADATLLVIPLSYKMRFADADRIVRSYPFRRVHTVTRYGVDFVDIYRRLH
jgi:hypothetical protein